MATSKPKHERHTGRHTAEFLLLFLAEEDSYGGRLLQKCEQEIPVNPIDSAILYRTLKKLEEEGAVESYWGGMELEKPVKMYRITDTGRDKLAEFHLYIENKMRNLTFFMNKYSEWKESDRD
ncbi:PadR family transcriptional regulator [Marinicrinis sediminis]|uniref:PadR family transcriptional regulator n=1 Tax=Marinicrinis sediminis TaxID=1652465 RepID=A0ABW5R9M9_9BACL